jgi:hypothetical protein
VRTVWTGSRSSLNITSQLTFYIRIIGFRKLWCYTFDILTRRVCPWCDTAASVMIAGVAAVPTFAAGGNGPQSSPCGAVHGAFANVNGNFGWLGAEGGAAGYHGATGQEPGATGYNNSHTDCQQ